MASRDTAAGRVSRDAEEVAIFRGSDGLWITLTALAALIGVLTLWVAGASLLSDGIGAALGVLLKGGVGVALLALCAWFAASQRREVVLDPTGIAIRSYDGRVRRQLAWGDIVSIEPRQLPSLLPSSQQPTLPTASKSTPRQVLTQSSRPTLLIHCTDGSAVLIDPQQVRDTANLLREAERRKKASRT